MLTRVSKKVIIPLVVSIALFSAIFFVVTGSSSDNTAEHQRPVYELPVRLVIPSIHVNASVEQVGLTSEGAMDVPKTAGDVAWYKFGQRPGDHGTAVMDGHFGLLKNGDSSVFDNLYKLQPGNKVIVIDENGASVSFVVRETRMFDPHADATEVFGTNSGASHLNLITCEGTWNKVTKSYSQRLVVFTDKE